MGRRFTGSSDVPGTRVLRRRYGPKGNHFRSRGVVWWAFTAPESRWMNSSRNDGGYATMITGYLQTVGVRSEEDIPYQGEPEDPDSMVEYYLVSLDLKPEKYDTAPVQFEVTDLIFMREATPEKIKETILHCGAVSTNYHDNPDTFNPETGAAWDLRLQNEESNHAVSVVGWDDHFPRTNFKEIDGKLPEADGAWLIKNSYGQDYGADGGYTWISYEDEYIFTSAEYEYMYAVKGIRKPLGYKCYSHDERGAIWDWSPECDGTAVFAVTYDFAAQEELREISFVTWSEDADYELYYTPTEGGAPSADESSWIPLTSGKTAHSGYLRIPLDKAFALPQGNGAILLKLTGEAPNIGTDEFRIKDRRNVFTANINEGTSFLLKDGSFEQAAVEKADIDEETYMEKIDLCIRAYTVEK